MDHLCEAIYRQSGYDFRDYAPASRKRRIYKFIRDEKLPHIQAVKEKILLDPACLKRFLQALTVDTSSMFRDPGFYLALRQKVLPLLSTYPFIRVWSAGCSTGEEVRSLAIILQEEGLLERTRLYATDINEASLERSRQGIYPVSAMQDYPAQYLEAGGRRVFSDYYTARYGNAIFQAGLTKNVVWAVHNLMTDGMFNDFHLILCRNVMIYFNRTLQDRVHRLLYDSLVPLGYLGLGAKESLSLTPREDSYQVVVKEWKIFRKVR
jgi:chemotaxis protein methyltransferase CheR